MTAKTRALHPAIMVLAVTFLAMLISAGVRSAPGVLIFPLELHFGWSRAGCLSVLLRASCFTA